jgi:hypothetical protein
VSSPFNDFGPVRLATERALTLLWLLSFSGCPPGGGGRRRGAAIDHYLRAASTSRCAWAARSRTLQRRLPMRPEQVVLAAPAELLVPAEVRLRRRVSSRRRRCRGVSWARQGAPCGTASGGRAPRGGTGPRAPRRSGRRRGRSVCPPCGHPPATDNATPRRQPPRGPRRVAGGGGGPRGAGGGGGGGAAGAAGRGPDRVGGGVDAGRLAR